jgi:hypothetical protein
MRNLIFCLALAGCGDDNSAAPNTDMTCVEGATQCVNATLALICSNGMWVSEPCATCTNGNCVPPGPGGVPCLPNSSVCGSTTTSLTCNPNGIGYVATDCPPNTQCLGAGFCVGSCTVGFTKCAGNNQLLTCTDGFTFVASNCATGSLCVTDLTRPNNPGVCAVGDCMPDTINGCNSVCGIMGPSPTPAATNFVSTCVNTNSPLGWRWQATQCLGAKSCDPMGADCTNNKKQQASCVSQCTPGAVRCSGFFATQTCDANGNWSAPAPCAGGLSCSTLIPGMAGTGVCAEPACAVGAQGICVDVSGVSQLRACSAGKLAASPAPCSFGTCVHDSSVPASSFNVGLCAPECQMGDLVCKGNGTQGCGAGGLWSTTITDCPAATSCHSFNDPVSSRPKAVCGVCTPFAIRCVDAGGTPGAGPLPNYEICGVDGQWGASSACTLGQCIGAIANTPCSVQCLPGSLICVGAPPPSPLPGIPYSGTSAVATCTAQGLNPGFGYPSGVGTDPCWTGGTPPAGVTCCSTAGGGTTASCRSDIAGGGIGCVACVGSGSNEAGLLDTRCSNAAGTDFGNAAVQSCLANNSGWGAATVCTVGTCHPPTPTPAPLPPQSIIPTCNFCIVNGIARMCSELSWSSVGSSCVNAGLGGPVSCPGPFNAGANDCCAAACYVTNPPTPAVCGG